MTLSITMLHHAMLSVIMLSVLMVSFNMLNAECCLDDSATHRKFLGSNPGSAHLRQKMGLKMVFFS